MDNVLEGLSEPSALSPLTTDVHDEDFTSLGDDGHEEPIESGQLTSDNDDSLSLTASHGTDSLQTLKVDMVGVPDDGEAPGADMAAQLDPEADMAALPDLDLSVTPGLTVDGLDGQAQEVTPVVLTSDPSVLTSDPTALMADTHLIQAGGDGEGILLTTDADGNVLNVPIQADQVIRLFMHTSDGSLAMADAPMQSLKLSMPGLLAGDLDQSQVISLGSLADGSHSLSTLVTPTKELPEVHQTVGLPKLVQGQTIKLENGTTALLQPTPSEALQEGLQAIQLEDGSTAFITQPSPEALFSMDGITLDHLANQTTILGATESLKDKPPTDKAYKCLYEDCGRLYTTQHHLKVHERSHTGDRPFLCEFPNCGKAFATGYGLKSHNRVHTGEKPYPCTEPGCEKAFKTSGDLQKHVRTHTGERPFKCPFEGCTRSFTTSNIRKVHIRTHTGERPYICDMEGCGRAFASATNYKNHIRIHTGEKPYVCTVQDCGKRFTEYSSLYKHHVVHTHTKPYTCATCGKTYRQTSTLAMHKRTAHGEEYHPDMAGDAPDLSRVTQSNPPADPAPPPAKKRMLIKTEVPDTKLDLAVSAAGDATKNQGQPSPTPPAPDGVRVTLDESATQLVNLASLQQNGSATAQLINLATLQQDSRLSGLATLPLGDGGQQVLVVTDPAQLEALQEMAAQHLTSLTQGVPDESGDDNSSAVHGINIPGAMAATSLGQ